YGSCSPFSMGEFKTVKRLGMLDERMSIIGSYLWIQLIMFNCLASRSRTYCEERKTRETKRPWWLAPRR
ncbi:hypothetical protein ALC56_11876, partial [Trachymyrmex septentrionalis]